MSRLMNLPCPAEVEDAASRYSGSRLLVTCRTVSSNAHGECGGTVAETFIET
jgi:hypothetical protein